MTTQRIERAHRCLRAALLALVTALAACGPGSGGTGTDSAGLCESITSIP